MKLKGEMVIELTDTNTGGNRAGDEHDHGGSE